MALLSSCGGGGANPPQNTPLTTNPVNSLFNEVTSDSSLDYRWGYQVSNTIRIDDVHNFCGGVAVGDVDQDGLLDIFVVRGNIGPHLLFRNQGNNQFADVTSAAGISIDNHRGCGPTLVDVDGDDDLDLFVGGFQGERSYLLINQYSDTGRLTFVDRTTEFGLDSIAAFNTISSSFGDYDRDGWLDLFLAHWGTPKNIAVQQYLWRNINGESFENASISSQLSTQVNRVPVRGAVRGSSTDYTFSGSFVDINNDEYPDLMVVSDFRTSQVLINDGDGTFTDATQNSVIIDENGMGSAVGDIDNDGDLDWFVTAIFNSMLPGNRLYLNQGTQNDGSVELSDGTSAMNLADGSWGWAACMADFNLDGVLDIFHVNGWNSTTFGVDYRRTNSRLYMSTGEFDDNGLPRLVSEAFQSGIFVTSQGRAVVCFDSDNDGDVDILAINNDSPSVHLYRNDSEADKNFLTVRLRGLAPNTGATNARIYVQTGEAEQMREVNYGSNFTSHNPLRQYFGLGDNTVVDVLRVEWRDGRSDPATPDTVMMDVAADQHLTISHPMRSSPSP